MDLTAAKTDKGERDSKTAGRHDPEPAGGGKVGEERSCWKIRFGMRQEKRQDWSRPAS